MNERPEIACLVGWTDLQGELVAVPRLVALLEAADYFAAGWSVLVDPATEIGLAQWERQVRANAPRKLKGEAPCEGS